MTLMEQLLFANVFLAIFNLLPAFPMDGGRVTRSLLALRLPYLRATQIAARIGRWMALLFVVMAIYTGHLMLLLIAGFVFLAGTAELMSVRLREASAASGARTNPFATWQTNVWPDQRYYPQESFGQGSFNQGSYAGSSGFGDQVEIIDAEDVRRLH
jgi:hypothetical protein